MIPQKRAGKDDAVMSKQMQTPLEKQLRRARIQERRMMNKKDGILPLGPAAGKLREKIPPKLRETLDALIRQSLTTFLAEGTPLMEKLSGKEKLRLEYILRDGQVSRQPSEKALRDISKRAKITSAVSQSVSALEGAGLGILGVGLPDIPVFLGMLLKSLYEIAFSYGFGCETEGEKVYMCQVLCAAVSSGEIREAASFRADQAGICLDAGVVPTDRLEDEIRQAASQLSSALLAAKFIQGIPIAGAAGGAYNLVMMRRVCQMAEVKYKRRYLNGKAALQ